ncbi:hypothetical protein S40285_06062 [Stachybotrys chlorohalonatus IBT 40285]|uniref:DUF6604 domain-containing protein n=1 Tax=Stachybotrys chlorohalonatus (strain IBT 40285) TaxID=1283841 RepID=A0A084QK07_STAC4|nr:hypothetical protein S40285_06062 [Stachybotrys chlorohalonata IBT 40285]
MNASGQVTASSLVAMFQLAQHIKPTPSAIYRLLRRWPQNPETELKRNNDAPCHFIDVLTQALEVLGGTAWQSAAQNEQFGGADNEDTQESTLFNKFVTMAVRVSGGNERYASAPEQEADETNAAARPRTGIPINLFSCTVVQWNKLKSKNHDLARVDWSINSRGTFTAASSSLTNSPALQRPSPYRSRAPKSPQRYSPNPSSSSERNHIRRFSGTPNGIWTVCGIRTFPPVQYDEHGSALADKEGQASAYRGKDAARRGTRATDQSGLRGRRIPILLSGLSHLWVAIKIFMYFRTAATPCTGWRTQRSG